MKIAAAACAERYSTEHHGGPLRARLRVATGNNNKYVSRGNIFRIEMLNTKEESTLRTLTHHGADAAAFMTAAAERVHRLENKDKSRMLRNIVESESLPPPEFVFLK